MRNVMTLMLILTGATVSLDVRAGELSSSPSYDWIGAGYVWVNSPEEELTDLKGFGIVASFEPIDRLVFQAAYENGRSKLDPNIGDLKLKGSAYVGTIGTYFPLSERVHLTADIGFDYETVTVKSGDFEDSTDDWFANAAVGIIAKPTNRLELGASVQRLEDFKNDGDSSWVGRVNGTYAITSSIDVMTSVFYENKEPGVVIGSRLRF